MPWDGRSAEEVWLRCFDCVPTRSFREVDYRRHVKEDHPERPEEDAMTMPEVAKALGVTRRQAMRMAKSGKLRGFQVPPSHIWWVRRKDLKTYVRHQLEDHPEKAVLWARTGVLA